jgi:hypothetical protein
MNYNTKDASRPPNCIKCVYFRVTWEAAFPRACQLFGVKSRNFPSSEIFRATGIHCPYFQEKVKAKQADNNNQGIGNGGWGIQA